MKYFIFSVIESIPIDFSYTVDVSFMGFDMTSGPFSQYRIFLKVFTS
jgi:hypothetical protein